MGESSLLARLFERAGPVFIQAWIAAEPTGQYARRAAFLYEWLTSESLQVPERLKNGVAMIRSWIKSPGL
jgi:hypothetical protein